MGCHWKDNVWTSFTLPRPKSQKVYSSVKLLHIIEQMMAILMSRDLKVHIVDLAVTVPSDNFIVILVSSTPTRKSGI